MSDDRHSDVKSFWEDRARDYGTSAAATLEDPHLRHLEIETMRKWLRRLRPTTVLDVGCGNGYSTVSLAPSFPGTRFVGIDYSEQMIQRARAVGAPNCDFVVGDILDSATLPSAGSWDVAYTQRCVQNILEADLQVTAVRNLLRMIRPGGALLLMECSKDGLRDFNALRRKVHQRGPFKQEPFHNLWLEDESMRELFGAEIVHFCSTYMLGKALHPRLQPWFRRLPQWGRFGYEKLYLIRKKEV